MGLRKLIIALALAGAAIFAAAARGQGNQLGTRQSRQFALPAGGQMVKIEADTLRATITPTRKYYVATGAVRLDYGDLRLTADQMSYDSLTGEAVATGHVGFDSESEQTHIEGTRGEYNFLRSTGEFDNFQGVSGIRLQGRQATALSNNPLIFSGKKLLRLGVKHYRLEHGMVTSCTLPHPEWTLSAGSADIELGQSAILRHSVFRLFDVPIFYAPFLTHSTTREGRHSGILLPVVSKSSVKGYILGDSFYWAAARNLNITAGGELYSARGWADHLAVESKPTANSDFGVELDGVLDRGLATSSGARIRQGGQELRLTGDYTAENGFRTVLDADYLSSYLYRLVFQNTFAEAINSEAVSTAFTEKQWDGEDIALIVHRYQDFLGTTPHASLSLAALPSVDWNAYAQDLSPSKNVPIYFSWDSEAGLLDRDEPGFATGLMERVDLDPAVTVPVATPVGNVTAQASARTTYYSESESAVSGVEGAGTAPGVLLGQALWRNSVSGSVEWRPPAIEKVYATPGGWFGDRMEHVIEPIVGYNFTGGVADPNEVIRFDDRDILANTSEAEYGFTNRLLAGGATPGKSRELISWTLLQKYYLNPTFSGALEPGERNVFLTTEMLSPFDIEALPLRFSPISSVVRVSPFARFDGEWRLDYDGHDHFVSASAFTGTFHFGQSFVSASHYYLRPPTGLAVATALPRFDQMRFAGGYGNALAPGYSFSGSVAYDAISGQLQYTTVEASRNWDCCGFSLEYRRFALASVRLENQFLVSFNLSNVATFGNLKRQNPVF